jgi:hypothetical protein
LGTDFRADLGHVSRVGFQRFTLNGGPIWYGDSDAVITRFAVDGTYRQINELDGGGLLERELESGVRLRATMQSSLSYEFIIKRENFEDLAADLINHYVRSSIRPSGAVDIEMDLSIGDAIDYTHARVGSRINMTPELNLNLGKHIRLNFEHELTRFNSEEDRLYLANASQARIIYQFNPRMFFRSILQYVDIRRNQELYVDEIEPISKSFFTQFLFSYKLNPRTVFYLGYSDNYETYQDIDLTQSDRAVFLKISYAWVL